MKQLELRLTLRIY